MIELKSFHRLPLNLYNDSRLYRSSLFHVCRRSHSNIRLFPRDYQWRNNCQDFERRMGIPLWRQSQFLRVRRDNIPNSSSFCTILWGQVWPDFPIFPIRNCNKIIFKFIDFLDLNLWINETKKKNKQKHQKKSQKQIREKKNKTMKSYYR